MADELLPFIFRRDLDRPLISNELDGNNDAIEQRYELANEARTDAQQARTDAQQARTGAQQARDDAQQARTDAQQARTGAQQARDDAQQIAENIDVREWLTGSTAPAPGLGANGDMYMSGDGSVWRKQSGAWVQTDVNVTGPIGPVGPEGPVGPVGPQGETGEGLAITGKLPSVDDLPPSGNIGDAYVIDGIIYIWSATTSSWVDIGAPHVKADWGQIEGTLSDQTDLQDALDAQLKIASNLSDLADASTARTNLGLGTGATATVTTSSTDTTAGRLLKVGDFGVGGSVPISPTLLADVIIPGDYWIATNDPIDKPVSRFCHLFVRAYGTSLLQTVQSRDDDKELRRVSDDGGSTWGPWQELIHTGNLLTATGQSTLFPMTQKAVTDALTGKQGRWSITTTAANKTLAAGELCNVTTAGRTITLPASPSAGDRVSIGVLAFKNTVVARNGQRIMGLTENMTIDTENVTVTLLYVDASRGWRVI